MPVLFAVVHDPLGEYPVSQRYAVLRPEAARHPQIALRLPVGLRTFIHAPPGQRQRLLQAVDQLPHSRASSTISKASTMISEGLGQTKWTSGLSSIHLNVIRDLPVPMGGSHKSGSSPPAAPVLSHMRIYCVQTVLSSHNTAPYRRA